MENKEQVYDELISSLMHLAVPDENNVYSAEHVLILGLLMGPEALLKLLAAAQVKQAKKWQKRQSAPHVRLRR